jgi:hypothetical protein
VPGGEHVKAERQLRIVAWVFIIGGVLSVAGALISGKLQIGIALLAIPAGIGLLRRQAGWRAYALVILWIGIIGSALIVIFNFRSLVLDLSAFGWRAQYPSPWAVIVAITPFWALAIWQATVLMRKEVGELFESA